MEARGNMTRNEEYNQFDDCDMSDVDEMPPGTC